MALIPPRPRTRRVKRTARTAPSEPVNIALVELAFAAGGRYVALSQALDTAEATGAPVWVRDEGRDCDEQLDAFALGRRVEAAVNSLTLAAAALGERDRLMLARRTPAAIRAFFAR